MFVPASKSRNLNGQVVETKATINRMGSIPHGTTINAQGLAPSQPQLQKGAPKIPATDIVPFGIKSGAKSPGFPHLDFPQNRDDILPASKDKDNKTNIGLARFIDKKTITLDIFQNPNKVLENALQGQEVESFIKFSLTTLPTKDFGGGGTANIGFNSNSENAHAVTMTVDYWIETVAKTILIKAGQPQEQTIRVVTDAGIPGPLFVIPPTTNLKKDTNKRVTWTQLQYSQNVTLNFNTLSWPHISVATLGDVSRIPVDITGL